MEPPELNAKPVHCAADKMHAFMLGKNLYQFLGNVSYKNLTAVIEGNTINFDYEAFKRDEGKELKQLIIDLTRKKPEDRHSVSEALARLRIIKKSYDLRQAKSDCKTLLTKIKGHQFGKYDLEMDLFIQEYQNKISKQTELHAVEQITHELKNLLAKIKDDQVLRTLHEIIDKFRNESRFYTIGMNAKAQRIEQAVAQIPILNRFMLNDNKAVLAALASHRHPFRANPHAKDGHIDQAKAANAYRFFKAKFPDARPNEKLAPKNHTNVV